SIRLYTSYQDLEIVLAAESEILDLIEKFYGNQASSLGRIVEGIEEEGGDSFAEDEDVEHLKDLASEAPVIRLVNLVISRALESRASDIHIEPFERDLKVRYRIDGILHDVESPPKKLKAAIISRIKIMSKLNIAERRIPQDGRIKMRVLGKDVDLRVSTLPTMYGESVVMRLLDAGSVLLDLDTLGFSGHNLETFKKILNFKNGIILVTGPTGSGKTTTLYAALSRLNTNDVKILTVDDPVEYQLKGANQMQVNPKINLTFASGLRAFLRQDPDIIMVGEVRDRETAEIAIQASLTGHLVLSTLHTNDASSSITRLVDMGVEPFLVASAVIGIVAQRLVRTVCRDCGRQYTPEAEEILKIGLTPEDLKGKQLFRPIGCPNCMETGYAGRAGIHEVLTVTDAIRAELMKGSDATAIKKVAMSQGMRSLRDDAGAKVIQGLTTVAEVLRVTQEESG
ncbi:MAG: type II secretion system ATPase GspE, partial [Deltaproteobacteria bacterium]|nr:type II secretion system ATPase GspE [Deltaproteobacteria bacterium]